MTARASVPVVQRACDCLDVCGDDPDVRTGRAAVCQAKLARDREMAEISERMELQPLLAQKGAQMILLLSAQYQHFEGTRWFCLQAAKPGDRLAEDLANAVRYLLLTKNAERHPTEEHLVRLTTFTGPPLSPT